MLARIRRWWRALRARFQPKPKPLSPQALDALMKDFARRFHTAPPYAAVGVKTPPGWEFRAFVSEAMRRYPDAESAR